MEPNLDNFEFYSSFFSGLASTILGGIILALFFFLVREKCFGPIDIVGRWYFEIKTEKTAYNPYKDMVLRYVCVIWKEGNHLNGSVEKIYENSTINNNKEYVGENRSRGTLTGVYEKNYFSKDRVYIHINEKGEKRESTIYLSLDMNKNLASGNFFTFIADQEGTCIWKREPF